MVQYVEKNKNILKNVKNFGPKKIAIFGQNLMFWPKMVILGPKGPFLVDQKNIDSLTFWSHLERHFDLSYAPMPQCIWSGLPKIQILSQKPHVLAQNGYFYWYKNFQK